MGPCLYTVPLDDVSVTTVFQITVTYYVSKSMHRVVDKFELWIHRIGVWDSGPRCSNIPHYTGASI